VIERTLRVGRPREAVDRARFYAEYSLYVAEPGREMHFKYEPA